MVSYGPGTEKTVTTLVSDIMVSYGPGTEGKVTTLVSGR